MVAWLESHQTTEGKFLQAFASLDDNAGARISEDGAGATSFRFVQRKDDAVAVYLDTRTSMVPVHARPVKLKDNALGLGNDVVVTVGGVPERGINFSPSSTVGDASFAFLPMPKYSSDFGMNLIPIHEPLKGRRAQTYWSLYPNGPRPRADGGRALERRENGVGRPDATTRKVGRLPAHSRAWQGRPEGGFRVPW